MQLRAHGRQVGTTACAVRGWKPLCAQPRAYGLLAGTSLCPVESVRPASGDALHRFLPAASSSSGLSSLHHCKRPQGAPPQEASGCGSLAHGFLSSGGGSTWAVMLRTSEDNVFSAVKPPHNCFPLASALLISAGAPEHLPLPLGPGQMLHEPALRSRPQCW